QLFKMLRILRTDEQMEIDEATPSGCHVQSQLHVGENELCMWQAAKCLVGQQLFVGISDIVVGDCDCLDEWHSILERGQILVPSIRTMKLVVHDGAWRMDMWLPSSPL